MINKVVTASSIYEFEKVVTPVTKVKINGQWQERGGNDYYICLDCRHWQERAMMTGNFKATCACGCHDLKYSEITQETGE